MQFRIQSSNCENITRKVNFTCCCDMIAAPAAARWKSGTFAAEGLFCALVSKVTNLRKAKTYGLLVWRCAGAKCPAET